MCVLLYFLSLLLWFLWHAGHGLCDLLSCNAKYSRITWRPGYKLQKWLTLYHISRGFTWILGGGTATQWDAQSPKPQSDINNKQAPPEAPMRQRWIHAVRAMPTWKTGGEETDLGCLPANGELQQRGVSKKAERIHIACKEWLIRFITVPRLLSATNAYTLYEEVSIFVSSNIKMHNTHSTVP